MKTHELPTKEELDRLFTYQPDTGKLIWKERPREDFQLKRIWCRVNSRCAGKEAGNKNHRKCDGAAQAIDVAITRNGKQVRFVAHRLIFVIMGQRIPDGMVIDHIDRNPWNNSWSNLRLATQQENMCNRQPVPGRILPKGVVAWPDGRYRAQIKINKQFQHLGLFSTPGEAFAAYRDAATQGHKEFARFSA